VHTCASCRTDNPIDATFCYRCGNALNAEPRGYYSLISEPVMVRFWTGIDWQGPISKNPKIDVIGYVGSLEAVPIQVVRDENPGNVDGPFEQRSEIPTVQTASKSRFIVEETIGVNNQEAVTSRRKVDAASMATSRQDLQDEGSLEPINSSDSDQLIVRLIKAQNRTTHAIRALVRFLFIQLAALTLAGFFWSLAQDSVDANSCYKYGDNCDPSAPLTFLALATWIVGVIISSRVGWRELEASNVPGENSGDIFRF